MRILMGTALLFVAAAAPLFAAADSVLGDWREPGGSVIHIAPCGQEICATLSAVRKDAPSLFDIHNPDSSQHTHKLCGLVIGKGFHETTPGHAEGGTLYDPKSGKTYHGTMSAEGDRLELRGYVGIKLFGRSETWTRTSAPPPCPA